VLCSHTLIWVVNDSAEQKVSKLGSTYLCVQFMKSEKSSVERSSYEGQCRFKACYERTNRMCFGSAFTLSGSEFRIFGECGPDTAL
jgi:hypothetical protein